MTTQVKGINSIINNLNKKLAEIEFKTAKGFIKAGGMVRNDMENNPPLIPLDLGNLRASWFYIVKGYVPRSRGMFQGKTPAEKKKAALMAAEHKRLLGELKSVVEGERKPNMIMGFSANYAAAVHEKRGANVRWKRPNSGPDFFRLALYRNRKKIVDVIKQNVIK